MKLQAFISYASAENGDAAEELQKNLINNYDIECFLSMNLIHAGTKWRDQLIMKLTSCHILFPILSQAFRQSEWTSQEVGLALSRKNLRVIPLQLDDTKPFGFLEEFQAQKWNRSPVGNNLNDLVRPTLLEEFHQEILPIVVNRQLRLDKHTDVTDPILGHLQPYFSFMNQELAKQFAKVCLGNSKILGSWKFQQEYMHDFLKQCGSHLTEHTRKQLLEEVERRTN